MSWVGWAAFGAYVLSLGTLWLFFMGADTRGGPKQ